MTSALQSLSPFLHDIHVKVVGAEEASLGGRVLSRDRLMSGRRGITEEDLNARETRTSLRRTRGHRLTSATARRPRSAAGCTVIKEAPRGRRAEVARQGSTATTKG
jgi:hypothetical protein